MTQASQPQAELPGVRAGSTVRTAVLALFARLGARTDHLDEAARARLIDGLAPEPGPLRNRSGAERALRRRARAAAAAVQDNPGAALEAALDVLADEIDRLDRRAGNQAEALKAIRLYAPEPWVRHIAQQALNRPDRAAPALPDFLVGNDLDDAELGLLAARYVG
jgi:hypothetical protein